MAATDTNWPERAGALAEEVAELAATIENQGLPDDPADAASGYLERVRGLLDEIRATGTESPGSQTRDALQALARSNALLRDLYQRNLTGLAEQRIELHHAGRALRGYAANAGPTGSRYLDDQG
ncbi:hypothetical protein [Thiohalorhabdus sp.]|uniref:hypothetical protein n=1 Tax=Thiohalorhabdus sp. TaxID=3094134 RepID=UPI002FC36ACA